MYCDYCKPGDERLSLITDEVSFGVLGNYTLDVYLSGPVDDAEPKISVCMTGDEDGTRSDAIYKRLPINFCPVCGRKIEKED